MKETLHDIAPVLAHTSDLDLDDADGATIAAIVTVITG
jgi:hypothetical protein